MIATPPGRGNHKRIVSFLQGPLAFLCGSVAGAIATGAIVALCETLLSAYFSDFNVFTSLLLIVTAGLALANPPPHSRLAAPSTNWQVPREWMNAGRVRFSLVFGLCVGPGVVTIVTSWGIYAVLAGVLTQPGIGRGGFLVGCFGLARSVPMIAVAIDPTAHVLPSGNDVGTRSRLFRIANPKGLLTLTEQLLLGLVVGNAIRSLALV